MHLSKIITKEYLQREYVDNNKSTIEIARELKTAASSVNRYLHLHGITPHVNGFKNIKNIIGYKFNSWTVIDRAEKPKQNYKATFWLCRCTCGSERIIHRGALTSGQSTRCKKCSQKKLINEEELRQSWWNKYEYVAKGRNLEFAISKDWAYDLFLKQHRKCKLSGLPIVFAKTNNAHHHGGTTASMDRIDNSVGYVMGNIQWVHKDVNFMKHKLTQDRFIELCNLIAKA